jgi:hypothetical protein
MNTVLETLVKELGLGHLPGESMAQLYRNGVNLGNPHYPTDRARIEFDIGIKNDHNRCIEVPDAIVGPFEHERSCGLARVVRLASNKELASFTEQ